MGKLARTEDKSHGVGGGWVIRQYCLKVIVKKKKNYLGRIGLHQTFNLVATYGILGQIMATYGNFWQHMASYGILWQVMATYDILWQLMASYSNLCQLMATCDLMKDLVSELRALGVS